MVIATKIPGIKTARRAEDWILSRFRQHVLILGYHRIADEASDPYGICITVRNFQEHMEILHRVANVISLQSLVEGMKNRQLPPRSIVITFDDGYSDLLYNVKPVLDQYRFPCTIFISTGYIGQEFWWDELEHLVRTNNLRPYDSFRNHYQQMLHLPLEERNQVMEQLRGNPEPDDKDTNTPRALTLDELGEFTRSDLVEVGSHGVNHVSLGQLPVDEQKAELQDSKVLLEAQLEKAIKSFSYPNGSFSSTTGNLVSMSGYNCACGSNPGTSFRQSDIYQLPRFWIPDWDANTFERWLLRWL